MSGEQPSRAFEELKRLLLSSEEDERGEAINELIAGFGQHVRRLARQMLNQRLRRLLSSEDILQSVCIRLVTGLREGNLKLRSEEEFLGLLKIITQNLARDKHAYDTASKRDSRRLRSLSAPLGENSLAEPGYEVADRGAATPSVVLGAKEREAVLKQLHAEVERLLQADEWHVYRRRYIEGIDLATLGAEWGVSADAIRMRLRRINDDLRERLKPYAEYLERNE